MIPTIRFHAGTPREALVDAAVVVLKGHPAVERERIFVRGRMLMQTTPHGNTRRLPPTRLLILLSQVAEWEAPTRDGDWRPVDPPNILRDIAARAGEWAPRGPELPRPVPRTRLGRARRLFQDALPGQRVEVAYYEGNRDILRIRHGFSALGEGGVERTIASSEAAAFAGWLARGDSNEPMPGIEFACPMWNSDYRWTFRAWRIYERAHEARSPAGAR